MACAQVTAGFSGKETGTMTTLMSERDMAVLDALTACHQSCESCGYGCCTSGDLEVCSRFCFDCATVCRATATLVARGSPRAAAVAEACARVCEECAAECGKHDDAACRECAEVCRRGAEACRKLAASA
jgi:hypothetical protein